MRGRLLLGEALRRAGPASLAFFFPLSAFPNCGRWEGAREPGTKSGCAVWKGGEWALRLVAVWNLGTRVVWGVAFPSEF